MRKALPLANLECGDLSSGGEGATELIQIQSVLQKKLLFFVGSMLRCNFDLDTQRTLVPFYARNILETTATALLARIDPFRVIITYKVQNDSSYAIDARSGVAIDWRKDIINETKPVSKLWDFQNKLPDFDRALFSKHRGEIMWKPAFLRFSDYFASQPFSSDWIEEMLQDDETQFFEKSKSMAQRFFSSFSKGIHSESLVNDDLIQDKFTLKTLSRDLLKWCCMQGLISHFSAYSMLTYSHKSACLKFQQAERMITNALY